MNSQPAEVRQYLSFFLGHSEYAAEISDLQEIKGWDSITRLPYAPPYVLGVINLRGAIVPVIDLRVRFGLDATLDAGTVIIVARLAGARGERIVGIVVDAVSDVYSIGSHGVSPADGLGSVEQMYVVGFAKLDDKLLVILDLPRLVTDSLL